MRTTVVVIILILGSTASGQAVLKGKVVLNNSNGPPPIPSIPLDAKGANPTASRTEDGTFEFRFPSMGVGQKVKIEVGDLKRRGLTVVNWFQLNMTLPKDPDPPFLIILAKETEREEMTRHFLHLTSLRKIEAEYKKRIAKARQDNATLQAELTRAKASAERLSDALASAANGSDSEIYAEAMRFLAEGDVTSALKVYEATVRRLSEENHIDQGALMANVAQSLLDGPVTSRTAAIIAAAAVNSWRVVRSTDAWNAVQRVPLVRSIAYFESDSFDDRPASFVAARADRGITLTPEGTVTLWDAQGKRERAHIIATAPINLRSLSPTGTMIATASRDYMVQTWAVEDGHEIKRFPHTSAVRALQFSFDGKWLATLSDDHLIRLWDTDSAKPVKSFPFEAKIQDWSVCDDGDLVAIADDKGNVRVISLTAKAERGRFLTGTPVGVAFAPGGKQLTVLGRDGIAHILSSRNAGEIATVPFFRDKPPATLALSPDGRFVAAVPSLNGKSDTYEVWALSLVDDRRVMLDTGTGFERLEFSADGGAVLVATAEFDVGTAPIEKRQLWKFDFPSPAETIFFGGRIVAGAIAVTKSDIGGLALASSGGVVTEFALGSDREVAHLDSEVVDLAYSVDTNELQILSGGTLRSLDTKTGKVTVKTTLDHAFTVAAFSANGRWLAYVDHDNVCARVVNTATGEIAKQFTWESYEPDFNEPTAIAISSNGKLVAIGQPEDEILVFRLPDTKPPVNDIVVSIPRLSEIMRLPWFAPRTLRFSGADKLLSVAVDDVIRVVEIPGAKEAIRINHGTPVTRILVVDVDGVMTTDDRGRIHLWDATPEKVVRRICQGSGTNLTREEWKKSQLGILSWRATCDNWPGASQ